MERVISSKDVTMLTHVKNFKAIWKDEGAVTALEYAILAGLVAAALVGMFATWGTKLAAKLTSALG